MRKLFLAVLIGVCFGIYFGYLNNGFVFDDLILVQNNPLIKNISLLPDVFRTGIYEYWTGHQPYDRMYRPLQMVSYYSDYIFWGNNPAGFRLGNLILHLFNSILVFYLIFTIFKNNLLAQASSILFLVHPAHISTVAYISARGDLLSAFFILSCCVLFLKFLSLKNYLYYFLSILAAALALLSRENALLIIFILILISSFSAKGGVKFKYLAGFVVLSAAYLLARLILLGPSGLAIHPVQMPGVLLGINFFNVICRYILLLFWPVDLRLLHSCAFISRLSILSLLLFLSGAVLLLAALWRWRKSQQQFRVFSFGLFWFLLGMLPVYFYFNAYPDLGRALMAESWLYLPSIGFCTILAYLCCLNKKGKLIIIVSIVILASLVVANSAYWRNDVTFYERILRFLPQDNIVLRNLAAAYIDAGDFPKAEQAIKELEKYYADTPVVNIAWGRYYLARGQAEEALSYYELILSRSFFSNYSVSLCYAKLGDFDRAIQFSQLSYKQNPYFKENVLQLASLYNKTGQIAQANKYLILAWQLDPKSKLTLLK